MTQDNRYAKGKIYRLVNSVDDEFYVGSTCDTLPKRFHGHKQMAKKKISRRVYVHLNEIGWDNVSIVLVEMYPCGSKMELERRERQVIDELKPSLNKNLPTRTDAEYRQDNREERLTKKKEYYQQTKDKWIEYHKNYRQEHQADLRQKNQEKWNNRTDAEKEKERIRLAEFRERNRDRLRENWHKNKDKYNAKAAERYAKKKAERDAQFQQMP